MRTTTATLATALTTAPTQKPIASVILYATPHGDDLLGPALVIWKGTTSTAGTPWQGRTLPASGLDPDTDADLLLADRGQLRGWWGVERPMGLSPAESHVVGFEGFWRHPTSGTVELLLVGNGYPVSLAIGGGSTPAAAPVVVTYNADANTDQREGTAYNFTGTPGLFYPLRVLCTLLPGAYGKVSLLWRPSGDTTWRLADASVLNVRGQAEPSYTLPGVVGISGVDETGRASSLSLEVVPGASSLYDYSAALDCYGILRGGRRLVVSMGCQTSAGDETVEVGEFYIDRVTKANDGGATRSLKITARDSLGKARDQDALLEPDILAYDLAGYTSDDVWLGADSLARYTAFDSWTLAEVVRSVLYRCGLSSRQLHGGVGSTPLIQEANLRLDRGATYRVRLPRLEKTEDLKYTPEPGESLGTFLLDLVEQFGYRFRMTGDGLVECTSRVTGTAYAVNSAGLTYGGSWTPADAVAAFAGRQTVAASGATVSVANSTAARRLRLYFARAASGSPSFSVTAGGTPVATAQDLSYPRDWSWRDGVDPSAGYNPSVFEFSDIPAGTIVVTAGAGGLTFQGLELVQEDPEADAVVVTGSRETVTTSLSTESVRNDVIVVGRERGLDTGEHITARAVDVGGIGRPASPNFLGRQRLFIYPDDRVGREDQARYLAYRELLKFRTLQDVADWTTPARPDLELEDPVVLTDVDTGTTLPATRYIDRHEWSYTSTPDTLEARSTLRVNPYPPLESYRVPMDPVSPPDTVTGFTVDRTDAGSLDPSHYTGNSLTDAQYSARLAGVYCPQWADEADAIHLRASLNLWRPSYVSLEVKDAVTHRTVAVLLEDQFLDWGAYSFLWGGRWFTPDGSSYLYFPQNPEQTEADWDAYQEREDPVQGSTLGRAGWVYFEARVDPLDTSVAPDLVVATNTDAPTLSHFHVVLGPQAASVGGLILAAQPVYATHADGVAYQGRYDVYMDEWTPGLPRGFKFGLTHLNEDVKYQLGGWLDVFLAVYESTDWRDGVQLFRVPMLWDADSVARGRHLWNIDGTPALVTGETDFLAPGDYEFLLDPVGLPMKLDPELKVYGESFRVVERSGGSWWEVAKYEVQRQRYVKPPQLHLTYRENYLDFFASLFPGKIVAAGYHFGSTIRATNRAGEALSQLYKFNAHRLENSANASNKHAVYPPVAVVQGSSTVAPGELLRLRERKPSGLTSSPSLTPHLTLPASYTTGNLHYD